MSVIDLCWHVWQSRAVPRSICLSFVDNLEVVCDQADDVVSSLRSFREFCDALDVQLDEPKLYGWSTGAEGREILRTNGLRISLSERDLGGQATYCAQHRNKVVTDRINAVLPFFAKLRSANLPQATKLMNVLCVLLPRALHACESVVLGSSHLRSLRSGIMQSLRWNRGGASPWVRIGLFNTKVDPAWFQFWRTIKMFRRQCKSTQVLRDWWVSFISNAAGRTTYGPFSKIVGLLKEFNLKLDGDFKLWFSQHGWIDVLECSESFLENLTIWCARQHFAAQVAARVGFADLSGFDYGLSVSADSRFTNAETEQLMIVRDGSFITDQAKCHYDARISKFCQWCNQPADRNHKYAECCRYDAIRAKHIQLFQEWDALPVSFREYGHCARQSLADTTMGSLLRSQG